MEFDRISNPPSIQNAACMNLLKASSKTINQALSYAIALHEHDEFDREEGGTIY